MSAARKSPLRRGPGRALLRIHRRIGIALSGVFIVICVTGILLNHTADLKLDQKRVESNWLYSWYGIEPEGDLIHYRTDQASISLLSETLYFNATPITAFPDLIGTAEVENFIAAASSESIALISTDGELIELLKGSTLPTSGILGIQALETNQLLLKTDQGVYLSDEALLEWTKTSAHENMATKASEPVPPELEATLLSSFRGKGLSWNRVVLDIHSGRFFGSFGKWIADISALGLIILTFSGIYYTMKYLKKARERAQTK